MKSPTEVHVGTKYMVPSAMNWYLKKIVPILFPGHADGEEICVNPVVKHYHVDHRFINHDEDAFYAHDLDLFELRPMLCLRESTQWWTPYAFAIEKLHRLYENQTLENNRCPHQGTQIVNSCGTCPNHGLIWNLETKRLKHKLPFYLVHGKNKFEIKGSGCTGPVVEPFDPINGKVYFDLVDAEGKTYPNVKFDMPCPHNNLGTMTIYIQDKNCKKIA